MPVISVRGLAAKDRAMRLLVSYVIGDREGHYDVESGNTALPRVGDLVEVQGWPVGEEQGARRVSQVQHLFGRDDAGAALQHVVVVLDPELEP